jgi:UDP-N-acetylglucosamine 2-epimerase (non-hydrolysing)
MRVLIAFGTRPEALKCFPVVQAVRRTSNVDLTVCVTRQHGAILDQVLELVGLVPDYDLGQVASSPNLSQMTSTMLQGMGRVLDEVLPDRVLVQGDTTTAVATALASAYRHIPVGHIEAGLRSGNPLAPWPEETNRRIISVISNLHFAPTTTARDNLLRENVPAQSIFVTGNTVIDTLHDFRQRLERKQYLSPQLCELVERAENHRRHLVLVTTHRRENWGAGVQQICDVVLRLAERGDVEIVFPVHPNPLVREPVRRALEGRSAISLLEPLDYLTFVDLMRRCYLILTDSGGIQEEAPAFGIPVLVLRHTTERPEGVRSGNARLVGLDAHKVLIEAERLLDDQAEHAAMSQARNPYGDGKAAARIAAIVSREAPCGPAKSSRALEDFCQSHSAYMGAQHA